MEDLSETGLAGLASNTESISKGVFAFKKGTKRNLQNPKPKKGRSKRSKKNVNLEDQSQIFGTSQSAKMRQEIYNSTWQAVSDKMKSLQKNVFDKVLNDVVKFSSDVSLQNKDVLPTCALVTGVNLPDHDDLFKLIKKLMRQKVTEHVAMVKSAECGTLKILMKKIISQLYMADSYDSDDDDEDFDENEDVNNIEDDYSNDPVIRLSRGLDRKAVKGSKNKSTKFVPTLLNLSTWYYNQYSKKKPPLIIVLEDFEGFSSQILQDLIANIYEYHADLPFILVFGIATTVEAVHRLLPHGTTSKLAIESFASAPSIHLLSKFVESIVFDPNIPFKLGGHALKMLLERFSFHDLSVRHFLMGVKICMLEHFSTNEMTVFCCSKSMQTKALEISDSKDDMKKSLKELDRKIVLFNVFVSCLHNIASNLPKQPLGKNFHHVYNLALTEPVVESQEYREAFQYLKLSEKSGLDEMLKTFINSLKKFDYPELKEIQIEAESLVNELHTVETSAPTQLQRSNSTPVTPTSEKSKPVKLDRFKLQEMFREKFKEQKLKARNPYEEIRDTVMDFLHKTFKQHLGTIPSTWKQSEIYYFDDVDILKQRIVGAPRNAAQMSLKFPWNYIQAEDLKPQSEEEIHGIFPDVCIAYKLHLECGKLINLYDWLQCWLSIVGSSEEKCEEDGIIDPRLHARFSRAVSELQFLGFIKPSKRKTDHVERLTF